MTQTFKKSHFSNAKHIKKLFNTTSLIVLVSALPVLAEPVPVENNPEVVFDTFTPPNGYYNDIVGLSGDGSTLVVNNWNNAAGHWLPYVRRNSEGSSPVSDVGLRASAVNQDGSVYVGALNYYDGESEQSFSHVARITSSGVEDLGTLGGYYAWVAGVSDNGNALTGSSYLSGNASMHAFYWSTSSDGLEDIGTLGGTYSSASAISGNGTTVVGSSSTDADDTHAFRWQVGGEMTDLGTLAGDYYSQALAVSRDGKVVAGTSGEGESQDRIFRWTEASNQMVDIGSLPAIDNELEGYRSTNFRAMSRDGSTIVGNVNGYTDDWDYYGQAFRWHVGSDGVTGTMQDLGTLGGHYSYARAVNADGSVVVGDSQDSSSTTHGFRWTDATGMKSVDDWLRSAGVNLSEDVTRTAEAVSDNGNVVAGYTQDNQFYYARVGALGSGIITPEQFLPTVQSAAVTPSNMQLSYANTAMFGAEGSPMRNLLNAGQRSAWGTVDSGYDKSNSSDGGFALGEIGMGYGIADGVTGRLALGGTYTNQDLEGGGDFNFKGFYVSPEVTANVVNNLYVTLGGYYAGGKIDIHRGYENGGALDFSNGNTDTRTWGGKLRFDWLDAVTIADTAISPYIGLSRANSNVDAYTESGGSFPVAYDDMSDHATIARLGADYVHPLTENVNLLARTEVAHRFESQSSATSAEILGLSSVDLPGQDLKQWWVRGGLGAEFGVGGGTASLMVNASTEGGDPRVWLRSGWKVNF
ncbi:autotransporter domain-containing protein [Agrobacterium rosae]